MTYVNDKRTSIKTAEWNIMTSHLVIISYEWVSFWLNLCQKIMLRLELRPPGARRNGEFRCVACRWRHNWTSSNRQLGSVWLQRWRASRVDETPRSRRSSETTDRLWPQRCTGTLPTTSNIANWGYVLVSRFLPLFTKSIVMTPSSWYEQQLSVHVLATLYAL